MAKLNINIDNEIREYLNARLQKKDRNLNMRIDEDFDELLKNEAKKNDMSVSEYIRFVVELLSKTNIIQILRGKVKI